MLAVLLRVPFVSFLAKMSGPDGGARDDRGDESSPAQIARIERMIAEAGRAPSRTDPPAMTGDTETSVSSTSPDQSENSHTFAGTAPALEVDATSCVSRGRPPPTGGRSWQYRVTLRGYGTC